MNENDSLFRYFFYYKIKIMGAPLYRLFSHYQWNHKEIQFEKFQLVFDLSICTIMPEYTI